MLFLSVRSSKYKIAPAIVNAQSLFSLEAGCLRHDTSRTGSKAATFLSRAAVRVCCLTDLDLKGALPRCHRHPRCPVASPFFRASLIHKHVGLQGSKGSAGPATGLQCSFQTFLHGDCTAPWETSPAAALPSLWKSSCMQHEPPKPQLVTTVPFLYCLQLLRRAQLYHLCNWPSSIFKGHYYISLRIERNPPGREWRVTNLPPVY